jgi:hypothetical protein
VKDREQVMAVINLLTDLLLSKGRALGAEQYHPVLGPDESDEMMREHERVVKELREIRLRLENLYMGTEVL